MLAGKAQAIASCYTAKLVTIMAKGFLSFSEYSYTLMFQRNLATCDCYNAIQ